MGKQLVFIDDSGDPGFKSVSSDNFVMAAVVFTGPDVATETNLLISDFRRSLGWREETEFKFRKTNKAILKRLLSMVAKYDFRVYAVYTNKKYRIRTTLSLDKEKAYNWAIKELLKIIPLEDAYIKIDGRSTKEYRRRISAYFRREINLNKYKIKDIKLEDSIKDNLIQLADIIAGSINRSMQLEKTDASDYFAIIKKKVIRIEQINFNNK